MDYQIVLAPDLGISHEDFISAWNDSLECLTVADARLDPHAPRSYEPLTVGTVLIGIGLGIATNAFYDLIKSVLVKTGVREKVELTQIEQPDGKRIIVIKMIKE